MQISASYMIYAVIECLHITNIPNARNTFKSALSLQENIVPSCSDALLSHIAVLPLCPTT